MKDWIAKHPNIGAALMFAGMIAIALFIGDIFRPAERYDAVCSKAGNAIRNSRKAILPGTQFEECEVSMKRVMNAFGGQDFIQVVTIGSFETLPRRRVDTHTVMMENGEVVRVR